MFNILIGAECFSGLGDRLLKEFYEFIICCYDIWADLGVKMPWFYWFSLVSTTKGPFTKLFCMVLGKNYL